VKASYNWLIALLEPSGLSLSPEQAAQKLTDAGLEVEAVETYGAASNVVHVAEVVKVEPHPKRDKLRLVTVETGQGQARVVCGAPNVPAPGGLVVLAVTGTELPAVGLTLTPRDIGGIESQGMLCSERELGLSATAAESDPGILVLPAGTAKPGTPLSEAVAGTHDTIFDIGLTPNRPDGLGHIGLARELCALSGAVFKHPNANAPSWGRAYDAAPHRAYEPVFDGDVVPETTVTVDVEDAERCPHYGAAMVVDVKVGPSPSWLKYRLESLGIRSISNVVDITNHILLELGHPIHAFDLSFVSGRHIEVRRAKEGEKLVTLDDVERKLDPDDLVIADGRGAVALAGVMGGAGSEIRDSTEMVLIECAYFSPRGIRRAGRRHGLHTESSHRFERGVDPGDIIVVLERTKAMLVDLAGGRAAKDNAIAGVDLEKRSAITLRERRMTALLGMPVSLDEATRTLENLGCSVAVDASQPESLLVTPPSHRPDLEIEADLIEEVVRVRGVDSVPSVLPAIAPQPPRPGKVQSRRVRTAALEVGLSEAVTFSFVDKSELSKLGAPVPTITLKNPLTEERSVMRTSLLPGLLEAVRRGRRHGVADVRLFTLGSRFLARSSDGPTAGSEADRELPHEASSFAAVLAGSRRTRLGKPEELDVYDAKGIAMEIVERASRQRATVAHQPADKRAAHLHPRGAATISVGGKVVGQLGPLHPKVVDELDLGGPCLVVELDLDALEEVGQATPRFAPIPGLPASTRDIALVVHDDVDAGEVERAIQHAAEELCESVELFDLFRGGSIAADHRSLAFHVVYRDPLASTKPEKARTLTDQEVDARHALVVESVQKRFGATLRG